MIEKIKELKIATGATHQELADACGLKHKDNIKHFLRKGIGLSEEKRILVHDYLLKKKLGLNSLDIDNVEKVKNTELFTPETIADEFGIDTEKYRLKDVKLNKRTVTKKNGEVITEISCSPKFTENDVKFDALPENFFEALNQKIHRFEIPLKNKGMKTENDGILVIPFYDIHIGKMSYKHETDENYCKNITKAVDNILERSDNFKELHIIFDGDYINIANKQGTTNAGTPQTSEPWYKVIDNGISFTIAILSRCIGYARKYDGKVVVHLVDGNHAHMNTYQTLKAVEVAYMNLMEQGLIEFRLEPYKRAYVSYENIFLAFSHGDKEGKRIIETVITEKPYEYGIAKYRAVFTGHLHTSRMEETYKVHHFSIGSPAVKDSFHNDFGYNGSLSKIEAFSFGNSYLKSHHYEFIER